jgi:hypothetical protein
MAPPRSEPPSFQRGAPGENSNAINASCKATRFHDVKAEGSGWLPVVRGRKVLASKAAKARMAKVKE